MNHENVTVIVMLFFIILMMATFIYCNYLFEKYTRELEQKYGVDELDLTKMKKGE